MKTIITMIIVAVIALKVILAGVDAISPTVEKATSRTDQVVAQATE